MPAAVLPLFDLGSRRFKTPVQMFLGARRGGGGGGAGFNVWTLDVHSLMSSTQHIGCGLLEAPAYSELFIS